MNKNTQKPVFTQDNQPQNQDAHQTFGFNHPLSNGEEIPVIVHPQAANNVEIKDMSPTVGEAQISQAEFLRLMRLHNEKVNANTLTLSAEVTKKEVFEGKQRIDKTSQLPILDGEGQPQFYPNRYKITLSFKGGSLTQTVSEKLYQELEEGHTYMFKGQLGFIKDFGQDVLSPIWQSHEFVI